MQSIKILESFSGQYDSPDKPPPPPNPDPDAPPIPTPPGEEPGEPIYAPPDQPIDTGIEKPKIIV